MKASIIQISLLLSLSTVSSGLYIPNVSQVPLKALDNAFGFNFFKDQFQNLFGVATSDSNDGIRNDDFEIWIKEQKKVSFQGVLNNIGGISEFLNVTEVSRGAVIASPSRANPDYFFQWTRDAALTIKSLIYYVDDHKFQGVDEVRSIIESYIENNYYLQRLDNKSGKFNDTDKSGLGEPKFLANNKPFDENWGRPQRDGPGLRAITVLSYLSLLEKHEQSISNDFLKSKDFIYHEIVKPDLIYIIRNWHKEGFDLWEEINSHHFFGSITQLRALKDGISISKTIAGEAEFVEELQDAFNKLKTFIEYDSGYSTNSLPYIVETPSYLRSGKRNGLDSAILLGSIHSHNTESGDYSDIPFDINHSKLLNTLSAMVSDMKYRYPINHNKIGFERGVGVAIGRYPEDVYDGHGTSEGNPWFLSTASAAEIIYKFLYKLETRHEDIVVNAENKDFFKDFIDIEKIETNAEAEIVIHFGSAAYDTLTRNLFSYSDSFLETIKDHVDNNGHMSEQFNKYHGYMQGAEDLTWSYSAVWNSFRWREKALNTLKNI